jgi:hypothetical protein
VCHRTRRRNGGGVDTYCILDMAGLTVHRNRSRGSLQLMTRSGETLALVADITARSWQEALCQAFEDALSRAVLHRPALDDPGRRCRVGLYNPDTGQVSVGAVGAPGRPPGNRVFGDGEPIEMTYAGVYATDDGDALILPGGRRVGLWAATAEQVQAVFVAA